MNRTFRITGIVLGIVAIAIAGYLLAGHTRKVRPDSNQVLPISAEITTSNGSRIKVRTAADDRTRELGLSYFDGLPADQGMVFLFDHPARNMFWMKGMSFPLDIVWLKKLADSKFQVIAVEENLSPDTYPKSFGPDTDSDAVLEINALTARGYGVVSGSTVSLTRY